MWRVIRALYWHVLQVFDRNLDGFLEPVISAKLYPLAKLGGVDTHQHLDRWCEASQDTGELRLVVIERTSEVLFACRPIDSSSLQASHSQVNIHKLKHSS